MSLSVLVIDDDPSIRGFLTDALSESGYTVSEAADAKTGIAIIPNWRPDAVLLDIQMPGASGLAALERIMEFDPDAAVIMITSVDEITAVRRSLRAGAYDYLIKPLDLPLVLETIDRAIDRRLMKLQIRAHQSDLESLVFERTRELEEALERIEGTYNETILALGSALETRDVETQEHSLRVARYTVEIMRIMGVTDEERLRDVKRGAFLHDIGKIGVPDSILKKPEPLSPEEWKVMRLHPLVGVQLLRGINFLNGALTIVRNHHERWDGGGYPDGLVGDNIPVEARAFAIADTLDAITSDRPYREGRSLIDARLIITRAAGTQFDPAAVAAFRDLPDEEIERIRFETMHPHHLELSTNSLSDVFPA